MCSLLGSYTEHTILLLPAFIVKTWMLQKRWNVGSVVMDAQTWNTASPICTNIIFEENYEFLGRWRVAEWRWKTVESICSVLPGSSLCSVVCGTRSECHYRLHLSGRQFVGDPNQIAASFSDCLAGMRSGLQVPSHPWPSTRYLLTAFVCLLTDIR